MSERKLRIGIPKGEEDNGKWLLYRDRWTFRDIVKRANIGEYTKEEIETFFNFSRSFSSEIQPIVLWPRDIARLLNSGEIDAGITTENLVLEEMSETPPLKMFDLGCSYVDLVFATTEKKWHEVINKFSEEDRRGFSDLELFLRSQPSGSRLTCLTRYSNSAKKEISKNIQNLVERSYIRLPEVITSSGTRGSLEEQLFNGIGDFMFESRATGGSINRWKLHVLEKTFESTAGLYIRQGLFDNDNFSYKIVQSFCDKLTEVIKGYGDPNTILSGGIERLVQVRFTFELKPKPELFESFNLFKTYNELPINLEMKGSHLDILPAPTEVYFDNLIKFENLPRYAKCSYTNSRFPQDDIHRVFSWKTYPYKVIPTYGSGRNSFVQRFEITEDKIQEVASQLRDSITSLVATKSTNLADLQLKKITFYRLKELYSYCPIFREGVGEKEYPCADASRLRDEHRPRAIIYEYKIPI